MMSRFSVIPLMGVVLAQTEAATTPALPQVVWRAANVSSPPLQASLPMSQAPNLVSKPIARRSALKAARKAASDATHIMVAATAELDLVAPQASVESADSLAEQNATKASVESTDSLAEQNATKAFAVEFVDTLAQQNATKVDSTDSLTEQNATKAALKAERKQMRQEARKAARKEARKAARRALKANASNGTVPNASLPALDKNTSKRTVIVEKAADALLEDTANVSQRSNGTEVAHALAATAMEDNANVSHQGNGTEVPVEAIFEVDQDVPPLAVDELQDELLAAAPRADGGTAESEKQENVASHEDTNATGADIDSSAFQDGNSTDAGVANATMQDELLAAALRADGGTAGRKEQDNVASHEDGNATGADIDNGAFQDGNATDAGVDNSSMQDELLAAALRADGGTAGREEQDNVTSHEDGNATGADIDNGAFQDGNATDAGVANATMQEIRLEGKHSRPGAWEVTVSIVNASGSNYVVYQAITGSLKKLQQQIQDDDVLGEGFAQRTRALIAHSTEVAAIDASDYEEGDAKAEEAQAGSPKASLAGFFVLFLVACGLLIDPHRKLATS